MLRCYNIKLPLFLTHVSIHVCHVNKQSKYTFFLFSFPFDLYIVLENCMVCIVFNTVDIH